MIRISQKQLDPEAITQVYRKYIVPKVKTAITAFCANEKGDANHTDLDVRNAYQAVVAFLEKYTLDKMDEDSSADKPEDRILDYLLGGSDNPQRYLEDIIRSFWKCVADVCVASINAANPKRSIPYLDATEIRALSNWTRIKEKALQQSDQEERRKLILSVINDRTCCLFSGVDGKAVADWKSHVREIGDEELKEIVYSPALTKVLYGGTVDDSGSGKKAKASSKTKGALDMLAEIFNYSEMNHTIAKGTPRHQLMSAMHIPVCPYCNRQYITIYSEGPKGIRGELDEKDVKKTTADLDHFYIKSQYPYLSLSLYNFIPSCQICNSRFKGTMDFYLYPHVYPYAEEFGDDVKFTMKLDTCLVDDQEKWKEMIELADHSGNEAVKNSISTFMLEQVYQSHIDYVQELRIKSNMYNEDMIAALDKDYGGLLGDKRSILDLIFGQYLDHSQFHRRPLSKLTRDILEECYADIIDWENI